MTKHIGRSRVAGFSGYSTVSTMTESTVNWDYAWANDYEIIDNIHIHEKEYRDYVVFYTVHGIASSPLSPSIGNDLIPYYYSLFYCILLYLV